MKEIPLATQIKASDIYAVQQLGISSLQLMELAAGAVVATLKAAGKLTSNQKIQINLNCVFL
jgi:NAD(P)H-hydrate repair Nnr-like enzyme with NAD(P)H-hydrate epimerase domain